MELTSKLGMRMQPPYSPDMVFKRMAKDCVIRHKGEVARGCTVAGQPLGPFACLRVELAEELKKREIAQGFRVNEATYKFSEVMDIVAGLKSYQELSSAKSTASNDTLQLLRGIDKAVDVELAKQHKDLASQISTKVKAISDINEERRKVKTKEEKAALQQQRAEKRQVKENERQATVEAKCDPVLTDLLNAKKEHATLKAEGLRPCMKLAYDQQKAAAELKYYEMLNDILIELVKATQPESETSDVENILSPEQIAELDRMHPPLAKASERVRSSDRSSSVRSGSDSSSSSSSE